MRDFADTERAEPQNILRANIATAYALSRAEESGMQTDHEERNGDAKKAEGWRRNCTGGRKAYPKMGIEKLTNIAYGKPEKGQGT